MKTVSYGDISEKPDVHMLPTIEVPPASLRLLNSSLCGRSSIKFKITHGMHYI